MAGNELVYPPWGFRLGVILGTQFQWSLWFPAERFHSIIPPSPFAMSWAESGLWAVPLSCKTALRGRTSPSPKLGCRIDHTVIFFCHFQFTWQKRLEQNLNELQITAALLRLGHSLARRLEDPQPSPAPGLSELLLWNYAFCALSVKVLSSFCKKWERRTSYFTA